MTPCTGVAILADVEGAWRQAGNMGIESVLAEQGAVRLSFNQFI